MNVPVDGVSNVLDYKSVADTAATQCGEVWLVESDDAYRVIARTRTGTVYDVVTTPARGDAVDRYYQAVGALRTPSVDRIDSAERVSTDGDDLNLERWQR